MNNLDDIYQNYILTHDWLVSDAAHDQHPAGVDWDRKDELNDYAYFTLLFGLLEDHIIQAYNDKVRHENTALMNRVKIIWGRHRRRAIELFEEYYDIRCEIAHGRISQEDERVILHMPMIFLNIKDFFGIIDSFDPQAYT